MSVATAPMQITNWLRPAWSNWRLALLSAVIIIPLSVLVLPLDVAFWVSLAAAAAVALTAVVNAWGHYHGPLLVAPAIALLFLMNIFPLMWSSRSSSSLSGS